MIRASDAGVLVLALFLAASCAPGATYEMTVTPTEVTSNVPDSFTIKVLTQFSDTPPIYRTEVVVSSEPSGVVSTLDFADVDFGEDATQPSFDDGPPPSYSFQPRSPDESYSVQTLTMQCLATGEASISIDTTWTGGDPDDPQPTEVTKRVDIPVTCN